MTMVITASPGGSFITATIAEGQTYLTFDSVQLETGPLNEEDSPPDALPTFLTAMQSGYMAETGSELLRRDGNPPSLLPGARAGTWSRNRDDPVVRPSHQKLTAGGVLQRGNHRIVRCVFSSFALTQRQQRKDSVSKMDTQTMRTWAEVSLDRLAHYHHALRD